MNRRFKIPEDKRKELILIYLEGGMKAVAPLCRELGVSPKYAANIANINGLLRHRRGSSISTRTKDDPRWQKAIQRGMVTT